MLLKKITAGFFELISDKRTQPLVYVISFAVFVGPIIFVAFFNHQALARPALETATEFLERSQTLWRWIIVIHLITALNLVFIYFMLRFMSELAIQRRKEKTFLESIGDGVVAIDRTWKITLWNKAASKITGWDASEVVGKQFRDYVKFTRENDRKENIAFIEEAMLFGKVGFMDGNNFLAMKNGKEVPVADSAAALMNRDGEVTGAIIIFRDASKERENQMLRSDFAYASHQLRTPVTKALWSLEVALNEKSIKTMREHLKMAYASMGSVNKLANGIFEVSQIDQGQVVPKLEKIKIGQLVNGVVDSFAKMTKEKSIKINTTPIPDNLEVSTDAKLIHRVVWEVLHNAIEYSPPKCETIVGVSAYDKSVLIEVTDCGPGIPEHQQVLIFTKFFRGNNIDTTATSGAGLGLYIAREYLKLLNGKIWFRSSGLNQGTTFSIELPR